MLFFFKMYSDLRNKASALNKPLSYTFLAVIQPKMHAFPEKKVRKLRSWTSSESSRRTKWAYKVADP